MNQDDDIDKKLLDAIEKEEKVEERMIPIMKAVAIISGITIVICAACLAMHGLPFLPSY